MALSAPLRTFVAELRSLHATPMAEQARWQYAQKPLAALLGDQAFRARAQTWSRGEYVHDGTFNLLFYEDPDHGFVINALLKQPGQDTIVHDHGHSWTLYALLAGQETVTRYERAQPAGAVLNQTDQFTIGPGDIDLVPPWLFHAEAAGATETVAIIVRSDNVERFKQNQLDPKTGALKQDFGPAQIPYGDA
ncbi:MAG: hypothetical protein O3A21_01580 [Proteobacteria bacterium]|nr:hypothetical protein [Pseudomonadota bacterium]